MTTIAATAAARAALAATREKGCDPSEPWPDRRPIEAEAPEPRPYPLELLPEIVREAIREIAHDAQAPIPMAAVSVLTACAVAVQHIADVQIIHAIRYGANLAGLTIARSGDRKSTVDRLATAALRAWPTSEAAAAEREAAARARAARKAHELEMRGIEQAIAAASRGAKRKAGAPSVEELRAKLATLQATPQPLAVEPDLLVEDVSAEALRVHLARHRPSAGLFTAEAGLLLGGAGSSGERALGFLATINQAFDGRLGTHARITRDGVPAFHCRLSVSLAVQPEVLRAWLAGDGALARAGNLFLLAAERRALATLEAAERALATVELDPALREAGVIVAADPVEPLFEALKLGALDRARALFEAAGIDARGLDLFAASCAASSDPARARREFAHALAGEPSAFDRPERTCAPARPIRPARHGRMPARGRALAGAPQRSPAPPEVRAWGLRSGSYGSVREGRMTIYDLLTALGLTLERAARTRERAYVELEAAYQRLLEAHRRFVAAAEELIAACKAAERELAREVARKAEEPAR